MFKGGNKVSLLINSSVFHKIDGFCFCLYDFFTFYRKHLFFLLHTDQIVFVVETQTTIVSDEGTLTLLCIFGYLPSSTDDSFMDQGLECLSPDLSSAALEAQVGRNVVGGMTITSKVKG